jgi:hypothetical protein
MSVTKFSSFAHRYPHLSVAERARLKAQFAALDVTIGRCHNSNNKDYRYYGGRGITVCPSWRENKDNYYRDMGLRPEGYTLDRKDNNLGYCKENCRWATREEQTRNRELTLSLTYEGETRSVSEWAVLKNIPYETLKARVTRLGYDAKTAIEKPLKSGALPTGAVSGRQYTSMLGKVPKGLASPCTALTEAQVREIRAKSAAHYSHLLMAQEYKVNVATISHAVNKKGAYRDC